MSDEETRKKISVDIDEETFTKLRDAGLVRMTWELTNDGEELLAKYLDGITE